MRLNRVSRNILICTLEILTLLCFSHIPQTLLQAHIVLFTSLTPITSPTSTSKMDRNLNSRSACVPKLAINFSRPQQHAGKFLYFDVSNGREVYWQLLQWAQGDFDSEEEVDAAEHVGDVLAQPVPTEGRLTGQLRYLERPAVEAEGSRRPMNVLALTLNPGQEYWFWSTRDTSTVFDDLNRAGHLQLTGDFTKGKVAAIDHGRRYMVMWVTFDKVVALPDSEEYERALALDHIDALTPQAPQDALAILQANHYLSRRPVARDLADDRYLDELEGWEVYIAERADLCAAEYLECKRLYMRRYHESIMAYRDQHELEPTDHVPVLRDYKNKIDFMLALRPGWAWGRRRTLVQGFDILGMLDEHKFT